MEFDFQENWIDISSGYPQSGTRCLVTDGEIVIFAKYIKDNEHSTWIFEGLNNNPKDFNVIGWMISPKPLIRKDFTPSVSLINLPKEKR
jgi:hypothetical protein